MEKVLKIVQLKDKNTDFTFWKTQTEIQRLEAVELLRQQHFKFEKDIEPRLQRICKIINKND